MIDLEKILKKAEEKITEKNLIKKQLSKVKEEIEIQSSKLKDLEKLKIIVLTISIESKNEMIEYIEELVTACLSSIFESKYKFEIKTNDKRDQQETHFFLNKNGLLLEPREDICGDSILNILGLGLRASNLVIDAEAEQIVMMDQPFKDLRYDKKPFVCDLVRHLSKDLGIQFNIITHDPIYIKLANHLIDLGD